MTLAAMLAVSIGVDDADDEEAGAGVDEADSVEAAGTVSAKNENPSGNVGEGYVLCGW